MRRSYFHTTINAVCILIISLIIHSANAQISTPCSSAMIVTTFTPCLNYVTGSSGTRSSPTQDCCASLNSLMTDNMDCVCLILTGNVPISIPFINAATLLPRMCKNSVPFQCKANGVPLPPPGPVLFGPKSAPTPTPTRAHGPSPRTHSPKASKVAVAAVPATPPAASLESAPEAQYPGPITKQPAGIRPVVKPNIASSSLSTFPSLFLIFLGISSSQVLLMITS